MQGLVRVAWPAVHCTTCMYVCVQIVQTLGGMSLSIHAATRIWRRKYLFVLCKKMTMYDHTIRRAVAFDHQAHWLAFAVPVGNLLWQAQKVLTDRRCAVTDGNWNIYLRKELTYSFYIKNKTLPIHSENIFIFSGMEPYQCYVRSSSQLNVDQHHDSCLHRTKLEANTVRRLDVVLAEVQLGSRSQSHVAVQLLVETKWESRAIEGSSRHIDFSLE